MGCVAFVWAALLDENRLYAGEAFRASSSRSRVSDVARPTRGRGESTD
ncbi:hypothetical protein HMPREF9004_0354 [Schaalia cardiffensis F0333]|uniref:Uncharacterized protein n=1 Tax=Schaalia cardiffensis F0333 TaxID=888050 RepID=N6WFK0_9ACTO|nr:hypothetical protein HMPREF9004_0354 [Schaalia cardiffensis F0333]